MPDGPTVYRVAYGDGEIDVMTQPTYDVTVAPARGEHDVAIVGVGAPEDATLAGALDAARRASAGLVRAGGAIVVAAQLSEEDADATPPGLDLGGIPEGCLVVVAASEAPEVVRLAHLRAAVDVEEALDIAHAHVGRPPRVSVAIIPRARGTEGA